MNITIYHHNDEDGWASAACVLKKYPQAKNIPLERSQQVTLVSNQDIVFLLDYSLTQEEMDFIEENNKEFIWIDHHQTAIDNLKNHYKGVREEGKAGCELTWEYLFPNTPMPKIIHYIGRYDVWDLSLEVKAFIIYLQTHFIYQKQPQQILDILNTFTHKDYEEKIKLGTELLFYQEKQLEKQSRRGIIGNFLGHKAGMYFVNSNISELGNYCMQNLADIELFVAIILSSDEDGEIIYNYSLRSKEGKVDVAKLAETQGGGGHPYAAGFRSKKILWEK
jgi:uncharacterized protein